MKLGKMRRRDWVMALVIGGAVAAWAIMDDLGDGGGVAPLPPGGAAAEAGGAHAVSVGEGEGEGAVPSSPSRASATAGSPRTPDGVTRFLPRVVVDRTGFGQPVEAVSVLVPEGWGFDARVTWAGEGGFCTADHAGVFWDATSPDGDIAVGVRPGILVSTWPDTFQDRGLSPGGYCHLGMIESHRQFAEQVLVPIVRPGNRILEVEEITEIPEELRRQAQSGAATDAMLGGRTTASGTAVVTRTPDGRFEEFIMVYYLVTDLPAPSPWVPALRMILTTNPMVIRAPAGSAERAVAMAATIMATVRTNPGWMRAIQQLDANISQIQAQGAADRSRILANSFREVGEIQMSGWQARSEADWRGSQSVADALAGLDRRIDPHTGQERRLDATGTRFFANAAGEYLVVDAPDIDPRRLFPSEDWREMAPAARPR